MITHEYLKSVLNYDEISGHLYWIKSGLRAGCEHSTGYRMIGILRKKYKEHRIIWFYVYGESPSNDIDHINRIKNDNRVSNLRLATEIQNGQNMLFAQSHSKTGVLGVSPSKNKFLASIQVDGVKKYLGRFKTLEDAKNAYMKAKKELHPFCAME